MIRLLLAVVLGTLMTFSVQPHLYKNSQILSQDFENWYKGSYLIGASVVFFSSLSATLIWYLLAHYASIKNPIDDTSRMSIFWWLLLLSPITGIGIALGQFAGKYEQILPSLALFYLLDIAIVYWLATALSTPGSLKYTVPGSFFIRRLLK